MHRPLPAGRGSLISAVLATAGLGLLVSAAGCARPAAEGSQPTADAVAAEATVTVVQPERQTVRRTIEQPGFNVEAFEETPLHARISGYVGAWNVDLGDRVRKNDVLATLHVPEMEADLRHKEAAVQQAKAQADQARASVQIAQARLDRSKSQYERLARIGQKGILDRENVDETRFAFDAARAGLERAKADVAAAEAQVKVAEAARNYAATMLRYAEIRAPFDGVVTQRNVKTGDLVQPTGAGKATPLFVLSQVDPVRVFVQVPGADAVWVKDGAPVRLRLLGAGGTLFEGKVTRNARSLDPQTRTLRTEIDVPNPDGRLMPGMYVHASITVEHPNAWTLPAGAVATEGDQAFCYLVENGVAVRTPLQLGLRGGGRVEVVKRQAGSGRATKWEEFTGTEVVAANASALTDSQPVKAEPARK